MTAAKYFPFMQQYIGGPRRMAKGEGGKSYEGLMYPLPKKEQSSFRKNSNAAVMI